MTTPTMPLPRFIALKSVFNKKYLHFIHDDQEDLDIRGFLQYSGEEILTPYVKYEVVRAKAKRGLVHLKSCYNNKFWVRASDEDNWIVAGSEEPEEDQSKWSCTLFEPVYIDAYTYRFRHVQLKNYASLWRVDGSSDLSYFYAGSSTPNAELRDLSRIVDWETLAILPKNIAFKGDNGKYLSARTVKGQPYHQFAANNAGDPTAGYEVFTTGDGTVRIKSKHFGKFWRVSPGWIWADSNDSTAANVDTLFRPTKVDKNIFALRSLGVKTLNRFLKRLTTDGLTECLNANVDTITIEARLEVEELALSRSIYDVEFLRMDARIYSKSVHTMAVGGATNRSQETKTVEVKLSYTETKSRTWNSSVSLKLGVKTTIKSGVPMIVDGKIEISDEFDGPYEWGKTETSTKVVEAVYTVTMPPMTMVTVSLLATKASCDVPFSYSQDDTLPNGQKITNIMDDGVYTGINYFNFKYETKQEALK